MDPEKRRKIASKGGKASPTKGLYFQNRENAKRAGQKGGRAKPKEKCNFFRDRKLASEAGKKGGKNSSKKNRKPKIKMRRSIPKIKIQEVKL